MNGIDMRCLSFAIVATVLQVAGAWGQGSALSCGDSVTVLRGDTLSRIADGCNVNESTILSRNPGIEGSNDLQVGSKIELLPDSFSAEEVQDRLRSFANQARDTLGGMARELGSSVDDLLEKNPDLRDRLNRVGDEFGLLGGKPEKVQVTLAPTAGPAGTTVTVEATGLPANAPIIIGGGEPRSAYEVLDRATSTDSGTLTRKVEIPQWATES